MLLLICYFHLITFVELPNILCIITVIKVMCIYLNARFATQQIKFRIKFSK